MRRKSLAAACAAVALSAACSSGGPGGRSAPSTSRSTPPSTSTRGDVTLVGAGAPDPIPPAGVLAAAARGEATFALALYTRLAPAHGNVVIAPTSIATVLGMVAAGAQHATEQQLLAALHVLLPPAQIHGAIGGLVRSLGRRSGNGVTLSEVDQAWVQRDLALLDGFTRTLTRDYASPLATVNFADPQHAADVINGWVSDRTHAKITKLVSAGSLESAVLVLTDAVYMDALWKRPFRAGATADRPFHLAGGSTVSVPTMSQTASFGFAAGPGWKAVALPYQGDALEMDVVVPDDLAAFERGLSPDAFVRSLDAMRLAEVTLDLPKFEFRTHYGNLKGALGQLGVQDVFDPDRADLSRITGDRRLFLGAVVHEAFVHVDERGTVAAGATGGIIEPTAVPQSTVVRADRPFLFAVRDRATGAIVFLGRVDDPRAG